MKVLNRNSFLEAYRTCGGAKPWWYVKYLLRGFWCPRDAEIYVNDNGIFLSEKDKQLLIQHEEGHLNSKPHELSLSEKILGDDHTWVGVMCPWGVLRYLTS
ncbi:MAG: hypothetical protein WCE94_01745 [Candidatus Methanoperedens sp.]